MNAPQTEIPSDAAFEQAISPDDLLPLLLRAHQLIELTMNEAIAEALPYPHDMEIQRLTFALKIDFCVALRILGPEEAPAFRKINSLRNAVAHRAGAAISDRDRVDLWNALSTNQRHLANISNPHEVTPLEVLRQILRVVFVQMGGAVARIRESKLIDEVLHDMTVNRTSENPIPEDSEVSMNVDAEIQRRMQEKRAERASYRGLKPTP